MRRDFFINWVNKKEVNIPDTEWVGAKFSPTKEGRAGDEGCEDPDRDDCGHSGQRGGQGELTVLGHHHIPGHAWNAQLF